MNMLEVPTAFATVGPGAQHQLLTNPEHAHIVKFYNDDESLQAAVERFLRAGLVAGDSLVLIATAEHRRAFVVALEASCFDVERATGSGRLVLLDARQMLDLFMIDGWPDASKFERVIGAVMDRLRARYPSAAIRAYGEMVDILWREGRPEAALELERLWNDLAKRRPFSLLCAYVIASFYGEGGREGMQAVCDTHSHVLASNELTDELGRLRLRASALEAEVEARKQLEAALRETKDQLESLYRIGRSLHADLDIDKIVQRLTDEATASCRAEFGAFFYNVLADNGERYMLYTLAGVTRERFAQFPMPRVTQIFGPTFRGEGVMRLDDVTLDPRYGKNAPYHGMPEGHLPVRSYLALPVVTRTGEVLGGLFFGHSQAGVFTWRDEELLTAVAAQACTAIENARLYEGQRKARAAAEQLQRRTERLHTMTAHLSRALGAHAVARVVIDQTRNMLGAEGGAVLLLDPSGTHIEYFFLDGDVPAAGAAEASQRSLAADVPICEAARTGELVWIVGGASIDERYPHLTELRQSTGVHTWGALPIVFEGRTLGAIGLRCTTERPLDDEERAFLIAIGRQCGQAIERARLHDATQAARAQAEEASRAKDDFLAMLGHELRNPLSPILTAVQLMKVRGDTSSIREQNIIERQVHHLIHLVDDLLDISRIVRGKVELDRQPIRVAAVVAKAIEIVTPLLEARRHRLDVSMPPDELWIEADEVRICQVMTNLLTNAAKYTRPGGHVDVRIESDGNHIAISVKDDGLGIPRELLPRVFDLFVQGMRARDRAEGGLGIGLALVRNIAVMHGGDVSARSDGPGHGSEFIVRLPALDMREAAPTAHEGERKLKDRRSAQQRRILIVDDNQDAAVLLGELLRSVGHDVHVANDGPAALAALSWFSPEVAILDIGLPGMDGYELAGGLRERLGGALHLVAVTGYGQQQDLAQAAAAGFSNHFTKPVKLPQLLGAIETWKV